MSDVVSSRAMGHPAVCFRGKEGGCPAPFPAGGRGWQRLWATILAFLFLAGAGWADADDPALRVKAGFIMNFLRFAEWPEELPDDPQAPFIFAVVGHNGMPATLKDVLEARTLQNRPIQVRHFRDVGALAADPSPGQALYLGRSAQSDWAKLRHKLADRPILTIAEMTGFCEEGGMLNLFEHDRRMRFEANPEAARKAGVRLRAELLNLATIVE